MVSIAGIEESRDHIREPPVGNEAQGKSGGAICRMCRFFPPILASTVWKKVSIISSCAIESLYFLLTLVAHVDDDDDWWVDGRSPPRPILNVTKIEYTGGREKL